MRRRAGEEEADGVEDEEGEEEEVEGVEEEVAEEEEEVVSCVVDVAVSESCGVAVLQVLVVVAWLQPLDVIIAAVALVFCRCGCCFCCCCS